MIGVITIKICKPLVVYQFYCMAFYYCLLLFYYKNILIVGQSYIDCILQTVPV